MSTQSDASDGESVAAIPKPAHSLASLSPKSVNPGST
jgi:hypothetical protein